MPFLMSTVLSINYSILSTSYVSNLAIIKSCEALMMMEIKMRKCANHDDDTVGWVAPKSSAAASVLGLASAISASCRKCNNSA